MNNKNDLKKEVNELRKRNDKLVIEYYAKKHQLERYQNQFLYKLVKQVPLIKRTFRLWIKYLTGKRSVKELIKPSINEKKANKKIKKLRYQLYELGYTHKALEDLKYIFRTSDIKALRIQTAFEIGLFYCNQYNKDDAVKGIEYLNYVIKKDRKKNRVERAKILLSECLVQLGKHKEAKSVIEHALASSINIDLILAKANLAESFKEKIKLINEVLKLSSLNQLKIKNLEINYNNLIEVTPALPKVNSEYKVSIIVPAYNSAKSIHVTIESLIKQTWENIEIIVVDDCSDDGTFENAKAYEKKDQRIKVLKTPKNSGPYVARNIALKEITGDFITINDADDWSHPDKIKTQAMHLIENKHVIANTSEQARLTDDLQFFRRGKPGYYIFQNLSSLMFRKQALEKLGFWDSVRFGADGEFKKRLILIYGKETVVDLKTGPLSFQRQSNQSLTGNPTFGYPGYFMGARKEYFESYTNYHNENKENLYYPFPMIERPFPVPEPMLPERENLEEKRRHFDVIIASDFRLLGGTNMSNLEEIKAQKHFNLKTGLIHLPRYDVTSTKIINPKIREQIDGKNVSMIVYGEKVTCDVLIVRHPPILEYWQKYVPSVQAKQVKVIINQTPKHEYSDKAKTLYSLKNSAKRVKQYFGKKGIWYPIGPIVRSALMRYHKSDLKFIKLSSEDWVNIININEWKRQKRTINDKIVIGRHSRDHYVKWPNDKRVLLEVYPNVDPYQVRILGGAKTPIKMLGYKPENWVIYEFGEMEPKEFLKDLDVFLYYTHPNLMEAFGRVMFEAMAVGIPVILPPIYKQVFKEAAMYAEWYEVRECINKLMNDENLYEQQVLKAWNYVESNYGYKMHFKRLEGAFTNTFINE